MSTSQPQSPVAQFEEEEVADNSATPEPLQTSVSSSMPITRTVAIIKTHALQHRFDVEKRIQEASFEIVKERQMEFDTETDPETLYELFGEDAESLAEGPVWVYVLERRRAVEVWNTLMGDRDTDIARRESPNSLRALYGLSYQQNGLMGSPDNEIAEVQIASLFASSPPFPTTELPADDGRMDSLRSMSSAVLESIRKAMAEDEGYAPSSITNPSTVGGGSQGKLNANGKQPFKARAVPSTHNKPDIVPRMTKAAALRLGQPIEKAQTTPRAPVSKEREAQTFANVPGHKRSSTIAVASTAAPIIAPRMSRAASLRLGQALPLPVARSKSLTAEESKQGSATTFEGVPGHKRRESIAVASSKAPTVVPRLNKSAALRQQQKEQAPPTSFMFRTSSAAKTPGLSRATSSSSLSPSKPVQRPSSQASMNAAPSRYAVSKRTSTVAAQKIPTPASKPNDAISKASTRPAPTSVKSTAPTAATKPRPRPSSVAGSTPSIVPRTNRSAALRAAKQEAENAAAAVVAARKAPRPSKVAPSSFKAILA